jgi:acyl-CoA dehydrogenase
MIIIYTLLVLIFLVLVIPPIRRGLFVKPVYVMLKKQKSRISEMEKQALSAGTPGFEKSLFSGKPNWKQLRKLPPLKLTDAELSVINGPIEELCQMTNDWEIRYKKRAIPESLWNFMKEKKLFGLRVTKGWGGFSLSFQAQSLILGKIASRSVDVATMVELPTSLWPDEIVEKYGTEEQKKHYLPRLAESKEIVAFAITGISNGSDATEMRDIGVVEYGTFEGKKVLGVKLNWKKRYITFAPKATLLVLGFRLFDPENILGKGTDVGISLALIPTNLPGIKIGRRHLPTNVAFPNGPIWGEDVFIPIDSVLGGQIGAGQGWKMIMECLFVGRAVALPAISVAAIKLAARTSIQYSRIRRQFGSPIANFEGIEEPLAQLIEMAYLTESARTLSTSMIDSGSRPLSISSLMKYQTTEYARQAMNRAMDIHAGRGVMDGPSNYLMSGFLAAPIGVTVEGANIVTRSIITFAQGMLQTHPYLYKELESCGEKDFQKGLRLFEKAFLGHIWFLVSNTILSFFHNITGGMFGKSPQNIPPRLKFWYRQVWRFSKSFAFLADVTTLTMGTSLKKRQKLGGRLSDAMSELFLMSSVLKRFEDDGLNQSDELIMELSMSNAAYRFQNSLSTAIRNFPISFMRPLLRLFVFSWRKPASDKLGHDVVRVLFEGGEVLDRLTRYVYISKDEDDITGKLEVAFEKARTTDPAQKKLDLAVRKGIVKRLYGNDWIKEAQEKEVLTSEEAKDVAELEALAEKVLAVDHFDPKDITLE